MWNAEELLQAPDLIEFFWQKNNIIKLATNNLQLTGFYGAKIHIIQNFTNHLFSRNGENDYTKDDCKTTPCWRFLVESMTF